MKINRKFTIKILEPKYDFTNPENIKCGIKCSYSGLPQENMQPIYLIPGSEITLSIDFTFNDSEIAQYLLTKIETGEIKL